MAWLVAAQEPFDKCYIGGNAELDKVTDIPTSSKDLGQKHSWTRSKSAKVSENCAETILQIMFGLLSTVGKKFMES